MTSNMKTIYKYPLEITDEQTVQIPEGADLLAINADPNGILCAWALVETENKPVDYTFVIFGTGHKIERKDISYFDSCIEGAFVWHIFIKDQE